MNLVVRVVRVIKVNTWYTVVVWAVVCWGVT